MKTPGLGLLGWLVATVALALVFAAYQSPHLVVDLASRVWACF
jgi:multisubunit Na+/H+ antiporter MnhB subunit